jgi:hypothetical protein
MELVGIVSSRDFVQCCVQIEMFFIVPLTATISPNSTLVCTVSSSHSTAQIGIHPFPTVTSRLLPPDSSPSVDISRHVDSLCLSTALVTALRSRYDPADLTRILSSPSTLNEVVEDTLYRALSNLDTDSNGLAAIWIKQMLGVAIEIYR